MAADGTTLKRAALAVPTWLGEGLGAALGQLSQAWLPVLVAAVTTLSFGVIPMTADQGREALLTYLPQGGPDPRGLNLPALAASLYGVHLLSATLRYWGARMLGAEAHEATAARGLGGPGGWVLPPVWYAPWAGFGLALTRTAGELDGGWARAAALAGGLALTAPIAAALLWISPAGRALQDLVKRTHLLRLSVAHFLPGLFVAALAVFGAPGDAAGGMADASLRLARALGPVALVSIALSAFTALGAWLVVEGRRRRLPLFAVAAAFPVVLSAAGGNDNHAVALLDSAAVDQQAPGSPAPDPQARPLPLLPALHDWEARKDSGPAGPEPVILVAAGGGGVRAAYFTAAVLGRIADQCPDAARRVFAVSGVSGGAFGAAAYAGAMQARPLDPSARGCAFTDAEPGPYERRLAAVFARDHLSPVLARALFADLPQRALPVPFESFDRQRALESSVADGFARAFGQRGLDQPFDDLKPEPGRPDVPWLMLNTTTTRGERVVATGVWPASDPDAARNVLSRRFPGATLSVAAAAGASARFTYVSPTGFLEGPEGKTRFVDGGYFDNTGLTTLTDLYRELRADPKTAQSPVIVLVLDASPSCEGEVSAPCPGAGGGAPASRAEFGRETLAPLLTLVAAKAAHEQRAARELDAAMAAADPMGLKDAVIRVGLRRQTVADAAGGPAREIAAPLGWLLSPVAVGAVRGQIDAAPGPDCVPALRRAGARERGYAVLQDDGSAMAVGEVRDDCAYAALAARVAGLTPAVAAAEASAATKASAPVLRTPRRPIPYRRLQGSAPKAAAPARPAAPGAEPGAKPRAGLVRGACPLGRSPCRPAFFRTLGDP